MIRLPAYVESLRTNVRYLRIRVAQTQREKEKEKEKNKKLWEELRQIKKERSKLEKERNRLEKELEKYLKTTHRYRASLFDHGNFHHPVQPAKKQKGGQTGHENTNKERYESISEYSVQHLSLAQCATCHTSVAATSATRQKHLIDIVLNPQVVKLIVESERQWCRTCRKEISARDSRSLPFTEYGINTFMMALLLRYRCLLSLSKIAMVFSIAYGLPISPSGLVSLFRQAHRYLGPRYEELKASVRKGHILYTDETGWQVRGKVAWMWIMASEKATVYVAAESRGKGIAQSMYGASSAYAMHDGYAAYTNTIPNDKQLYCWAHMLRFCFEETVDKPPTHESVHIRDALVAVYHLKKELRYQQNLDALEQEACKRIDLILSHLSDDPTTGAICHRLHTQRDGLIRALIVAPNGTNNFAEQELRPMALARRISYGSDTYTGMETTATLSSIVQTFMRTNRDQFFPLLAASLRAGVANS